MSAKSPCSRRIVAVALVRYYCQIETMSEAHPQGNQNIITEPPRRRRWLGLPVIQPVGDTLRKF